MLALLACMSSAYAWDVTGNLSWPDTTGKNLTYTEVKEVKEIAITDVYSNTDFKQVKYWDFWFDFRQLYSNNAHPPSPTANDYLA